MTKLCLNIEHLRQPDIHKSDESITFLTFIFFVSDILKGSVGILNNYNLCHIKSIQWDEIITGAQSSPAQSRYVYVYNFKEPERDCTPCHESCEVK